MKMSLEKKVGAFFVLGLILLMGLVELAEDVVVFAKKYDLRARFYSVQGLRIGGMVTLAGVEVGEVKEINVLEKKVEVIMRLNSKAQIRTDSVAIVKMTSLLGEKYIDISLGTPGNRMLLDSSLIETQEADDINALVKTITNTAAEAQDLFSSFNKNQKQIFAKLSNVLDENEEGIHQAIESFSQVGPKLSKALDSVETVSADLQDIAAKVNSGEGTLGKLINDPTLYDEATRTMQEVGQAAESVQEGGPIMTFSSLLLGLAH